MLIRKLAIKRENTKHMNATKNKVGRPKKARVGRPKVEKYYIVDGATSKFAGIGVMTKADVEKEIRSETIMNGTIIKEVIVKKSFKVVKQDTHIVEL